MNFNVRGIVFATSHSIFDLAINYKSAHLLYKKLCVSLCPLSCKFHANYTDYFSKTETTTCCIFAYKGTPPMKAYALY